MRTICSVITLIAVSSIPLSGLAAAKTPSPYITSNYIWSTPTKSCQDSHQQPADCTIGLPIGTQNWILIANDGKNAINISLYAADLKGPLPPNIVIDPQSAQMVQIDNKTTPVILLMQTPPFAINTTTVANCPTGGSPYRYGLAINTDGAQTQVTCGIIPGCKYAIPGALPKFTAYSNGLNHVPMGAVAYYCQN